MHDHFNRYACQVEKSNGLKKMSEIHRLHLITLKESKGIHYAFGKRTPVSLPDETHLDKPRTECLIMAHAYCIKP